MNILYLGTIHRDGTSQQRFRILKEMGHSVIGLESGSLCFNSGLRPLKVFFNRTHRIVDWRGLNRAVIKLAQEKHFDLLWADKVLTLSASTLQRIKKIQPELRTISYSPDDMLNPRNQSRQYVECIPFFDLHGTTKSYNVEELKELGAKEVRFVHNAFDPSTHRPVELTTDELERYAADISFVGHFEAERWKYLKALAQAGLHVVVRGPGWPQSPGGSLRVESKWFVAEEYSKIVAASKINLCFLRRENRDLQTQRSVEIPACGGFLLAERTDEHLALFEEGSEAVFFEGFDELLTKCKHYLSDDSARAVIAQSGYERVKRTDYSYQAQLERIIL